MVYAVWVVRREYARKHPEITAEVFRAFRKSLAMSIDGLDKISEEIARWETFSAEFLEDYFRTLQFTFGRDYQQGLLCYYRMAVKIGALSSVPELEFVDVSKVLSGC